MNFKTLNDKEILSVLGERVKRQRLNQNITQIELSKKSGIARIVIHRLENGLGCKLENVIRILRSLQLLDQLDLFLPEPGVSPIQLAKLKGHERQRASKERS